MTRPALAIALGLFVVIRCATPALAQPAPATSTAQAGTAQAPASDDDDGRLRPLEPDFRLINLPTTLPLPLHKGNFHLTHRFNGNLRDGGFGTQLSNFFGLDQGATIQFEYRFAVMKHLQAIASRTNRDRTVQFSAKYDAFHQSGSMPLGFSGIVSIEGSNNFRTRYTPAVGVVVSRTLGSAAAVYVTPFWAHNTFPGTGTTRDTAYVGFGARVRITPTVFLAGEVTPRAGGYAPGKAEFAFAVEKRVASHVFSLTFANTAATTYGQLARGGTPETLYLGFNLARKFY